MRKQAVRWGAELYTEDVEFLDVQNRPFTIRTADQEVICSIHPFPFISFPLTPFSSNIWPTSILMLINVYVDLF